MFKIDINLCSSLAPKKSPNSIELHAINLQNTLKFYLSEKCQEANIKIIKIVTIMMPSLIWIKHSNNQIQNHSDKKANLWDCFIFG